MYSKFIQDNKKGTVFNFTSIQKSGGDVEILAGRTIYLVSHIYPLSSRRTNTTGVSKFLLNTKRACPTYYLWKKYAREKNKVDSKWYTLRTDNGENLII